MPLTGMAVADDAVIFPQLHRCHRFFALPFILADANRHHFGHIYYPPTCDIVKFLCS